MANPEPTTRRKPRFRERNALKQPATKYPVSTGDAAAPVAPSPPPVQTETRREKARREQRPADWPAGMPLAAPRVTLETALYAAVLLAGFTLRIWDVGSRAMHGDEAEHAWFAWHIFNGTGYQYDPVYHGPLQFIVTAFFYFLFGVSDTTARLMAVLFGTALIVLPYFLRRFMGRAAALLAAGYIAVSPAFVYISRLERDDIFTCFFALTLAIGILQYMRTRQVRYVYLCAASIALSLAAMENTYITLFIFGTFVANVVASEQLSRSRAYAAWLRTLWLNTGGLNLVRTPVLLGLGAVLVLAFGLTVWSGLALPVPLVLAVVLILLVHRQTVLQTTEGGEATYSDALLGIRRQQWLNAVTILVAILFLTYSTFGTTLRGIWDASQPFFGTPKGCPNSYFLNPCRKDIVGGLFYWLSQHGVHRGGQPWFYYTLLFGLYEQIAIVFGLGGILWYLRRPTFFTSFLSYWAILAFGIYSWAGEKFPWLMIHPLLPFSLLAAMFVVELGRLVSPLKWIALGAAALLLLLELHSMYEVNFVNGADPIEMMVYVQSAPDTPVVARDILALSNKVTNGTDLHVTIDSLDTWPFAWYLRDMPNIAYIGSPALLQKPYSTNPAIIVDEADQPELLPQIRTGYTGHLYWLRWWFPEDYKTLTWGSFWQDLRDPGYWSVVWQWLIDRRPFGPRQGLHFYYYVKKGIASPY
ncbi:MAG: TIGR03663 family protein [Chloroflexi bacterium]|nr:TIGR03663 family protein [Chloroflexota bacterium]